MPYFRVYYTQGKQVKGKTVFASKRVYAKSKDDAMNRVIKSRRPDMTFIYKVTKASEKTLRK